MAQKSDIRVTGNATFAHNKAVRDGGEKRHKTYLNIAAISGVSACEYVVDMLAQRRVASRELLLCGLVSFVQTKKVECRQEALSGPQ